MKMKRIIGTVLAALGMILGLMGCQISKDSTSTSGSGVAGTSSAVSASSVDVEPAGGAEEACGGKYGSCSVNSSYVTGDSVIVQYDLEGKKQKTYRMDNLESVLQVTADWFIIVQKMERKKSSGEFRFREREKRKNCC